MSVPGTTMPSAVERLAQVADAGADLRAHMEARVEELRRRMAVGTATEADAIAAGFMRKPMVRQ